MSEVNIDIDKSDFDKKMTTIITELPLIPGAMLDEGSAILEEQMIAAIPRRTGRLAGSVQREIGTDQAIIKTTAGYGLFVDEDTRPHVIEPVFANLLRFEIDGVTVFARRVRHPGTTGQHFTVKAIQNSIGELTEMVKRVMSDLFKRGIAR